MHDAYAIIKTGFFGNASSYNVNGWRWIFNAYTPASVKTETV